MVRTEILTFHSSVSGKIDCCGHDADKDDETIFQKDYSNMIGEFERPQTTQGFVNSQSSFSPSSGLQDKKVR